MITHRTATATVTLLIAATLIAGCGGSGGQAAVTAPPASPDTAAEQAATMSWLAATNDMWTKHNFAALDEVTTGSMRAVYQYEQTNEQNHPSLTLTDLSITRPCPASDSTVFVAYARTDVFSLGHRAQSVAMVFQHVGASWQLAAAVTHFDGSSWPALCQGDAADNETGALTAANYPRTLATLLTRASNGVTPTVAQARPFAVNSFLTGADSIPHQSGTSRTKDQSAGDKFTQSFTTTTGPMFALPLANSAGYWLIGTLEQHVQLDSATGITGKTWPDGTQAIPPDRRPSTINPTTSPRPIPRSTRPRAPARSASTDSSEPPSRPPRADW